MSQGKVEKDSGERTAPQTHLSDIAPTLGKESQHLTLQHPGSQEKITAESIPITDTPAPQSQLTLFNSQQETVNVGVSAMQNLANQQAERQMRRFPVTDWERYECLGFIGEGGMGRVYKALDPRLKRTVAIKFIRGNDTELINRFIFEAQAQASIEHANICKVYETGVVENYPFIAMQYIEGSSLREIKQQLNLEQKVKLIRDVALALHAAHKQGIIHRDIKPANIMVEQRDDGEWHPYVMDFGLARNTQQTGETRTGAVLGTPAYMSPEQATGKNRLIDRRSDIYSLGATLYELISGQPPFSGNSGLEILLKVAREEPPLLRVQVSNTPADLDAIVMKCLEKEQVRRYDSAKALASDLTRFLDGEPIEARQIGLLYILKRRAAKHRGLLVVSTISLLVILIFVGIGIYSRVMASRQVAAAQYFGETVKEMESFALISNLSPLHEKSLEVRLLQQRIDEIRGQMRGMGREGVGPGNTALAQAFQILGEYQLALGHIKTAWQSGYQNSEVALIYGDILGEYYFEATTLMSPSDKAAKDRLLEEADKLYRKPAINYLKLAIGSKSCPPAYIDGLIAFLSEDFDQALLKADQAMVQSPMFFSALKLKVQSQLKKAELYAQREDLRGSLQEYHKLGEITRNASEILRSDATLCQIELLRCLNVGIINSQIGQPYDEYFQQAIAISDKALLIEPKNSRNIINRASIFYNMGIQQYLHGNAPIALDQALILAEQAYQITPDFDYVNITIGQIYYHKGNYTRANGQDPVPYWAKGIEVYQRVLKTDPNNFEINVNLGNLYWLQALHGLGLGQDVRTQLDQAVKHFEIGLEFNTDPMTVLNQSGNAYEVRGEFEASRGIDPQPWLERATINYQKVMAINSTLHTPYANLGIVNKSRGKYQMIAGIDPRPAFQQAIEFFRKAIDLQPSANTCQWLGETYLRQAQYQLREQLDPTKSIADGQMALKQGLQVNPNHFENYLRQAQLEIVQARWLNANHKSAPGLNRVNQLLQKAQQLNNRNAEVYQTQAELQLLIAEELLKRGAKITTQIDAGLTSIEQALSINRNLTEALVIKNRLLLIQADVEQDVEKRKEIEAAAKKALVTAKSINPLIQAYQPVSQSANQQK